MGTASHVSSKRQSKHHKVTGEVKGKVMEHRQKNGPPIRVPHVYAGRIHHNRHPHQDKQAS